MAGSFISCEKQEKDDGSSISISCATEVLKKATNIYVNVVAQKDWTISIAYDEGVTGWAGFDTKRTQQTTSGTGEGLVLLNFTVNNTEVDRSLYLIANSGSKSDTAYFVQRKYDVTTKDRPDNVPKWMELPSCNDSSLEYYNHDMTVGGKIVRNYSFYYDAKRLVSHWVAYPMWSALMSTGGRSDAWGLCDPKISDSRQQYIKSGYGGGYDRGHQLPSRDRCKVGAANVETFYGPNVTPQLSGLNQYGWVSLEGKVFNWTTSFDTLYIVTGCTVLDSKSTARDNLGKAVSIPTAYYKAILGYRSRDYQHPYYSVAFYYPHESYSGDPSNKSLTVAELEAKLKTEHNETIEFFVNLPSGQKSTVKSMTYSDWLKIL